MATSIEDLNELAAYLATAKLEDADQIQTACEALAEAMNAVDAVAEQKKTATAALRKLLDAALEPFKAPALAAESLLVAAKGALIRRLEADDDAAARAIAAKTTVPTPRALPNGLQVKRGLVIASIDLAKIPDAFTCRIADTEAILATIAAGGSVAGAEAKETIAVQLNRKIAGL